jgi:hypothetical protein
MTVAGTVTQQAQPTPIPKFTFFVPYGIRAINVTNFNKGLRDYQTLSSVTVAFFGSNNRRFYRSDPILVEAEVPEGFILTYEPTPDEWQAIVTASGAASGSPATIHWSLITETNVGGWHSEYQSDKSTFTLTVP